MDRLKKSNELAAHFFRHEYAKMVAVIAKYFGLGQLNLAEDIVQDTLLEAITSWDYRGIPENPTAWLYTVAKNKALNAANRKKYRDQYEIEAQHRQTGHSLDASVDEIFTDARIADDQLRMMFACCHSSLSQESQVALILKTLCGLSITEIAKAYITNEETMNKRLVRARKTLRQNNVRFAIPEPAEITARIDAVLKTIYLLFNEGYSATKGRRVIRYDLCMDAVRLVELLVGNKLFQGRATIHALLALMLLNASRFNARENEAGDIIEMAKQDRTEWDQKLINKGLAHLDRIEDSGEVSVYHFMAGISAYHCTAPDYAQTDWRGILALYDGLISHDSSPVVQLNRAIAISYVHGHARAIEVVEGLVSTALKDYYLLHSTLAELYRKAGRYAEAQASLVKAIDMGPTDSELRLLNFKLEHCNSLLK